MNKLGKKKIQESGAAGQGAELSQGNPGPTLPHQEIVRWRRKCKRLDETLTSHLSSFRLGTGGGEV